MFDIGILPQHREQTIFIQKQIEKCVNTIQKNLEEIANMANKNEKDILQEINAVLERKTDYLKKELEEVKRYLYEIENKE
ncbi:MAG: hypothetical protein K6A44_06765 [bacterium]|nr:hypothetical protein [bacterium]